VITWTIPSTARVQKSIVRLQVRQIKFAADQPSDFQIDRSFRFALWTALVFVQMNELLDLIFQLIGAFDPARLSPAKRAAVLRPV
jgi:hypothetical protein